MAITEREEPATGSNGLINGDLRHGVSSLDAAAILREVVHEQPVSKFRDREIFLKSMRIAYELL